MDRRVMPEVITLYLPCLILLTGSPDLSVSSLCPSIFEYRVGADTPFLDALIEAAESGKQVACLVEVTARFDELQNLRMAEALEKAGVHVAYGLVGFKTRCKTILVVREDADGLRCYAHIGTGNYHVRTA